MTLISVSVYMRIKRGFLLDLLNLSKRVFRVSYKIMLNLDEKDDVETKSTGHRRVKTN